VNECYENENCSTLISNYYSVDEFAAKVELVGLLLAVHYYDFVDYLHYYYCLMMDLKVVQKVVDLVLKLKIRSKLTFL
jgi:hypothetical protein